MRRRQIAAGRWWWMVFPAVSGPESEECFSAQGAELHMSRKIRRIGVSLWTEWSAGPMRL